MLGVLLRRQGWPVAYLGQNVPFADLAVFVEQIQPGALVLVGMLEEPARLLADWPQWIKQTAGRPLVTFAGRAFVHPAGIKRAGAGDLSWRQRASRAGATGRNVTISTIPAGFEPCGNCAFIPLAPAPVVEQIENLSFSPKVKWPLSLLVFQLILPDIDRIAFLRTSLLQALSTPRRSISFWKRRTEPVWSQGVISAERSMEAEWTRQAHPLHAKW